MRVSDHGKHTLPSNEASLRLLRLNRTSFFTTYIYQVALSLSKYSSWNASQRSYIAHNWNAHLSYLKHIEHTHSLNLPRSNQALHFPWLTVTSLLICPIAFSWAHTRHLIPSPVPACDHWIINTYNGSTFPLEGFPDVPIVNRLQLNLIDRQHIMHWIYIWATRISLMSPKRNET